MSKDPERPQPPLLDRHLCSCYLKHDPWTIRISSRVTWNLVRRENLRLLLDLLSENPHYMRTCSNLSGIDLYGLQLSDLPRSLFQCLWSRRNDFCLMSLLWWLIMWTCKTAVFGAWPSCHQPSHTHTHTEQACERRQQERAIEWGEKVSGKGGIQVNNWNYSWHFRNFPLVCDDCILIL